MICSGRKWTNTFAKKRPSAQRKQGAGKGSRRVRQERRKRSIGYGGNGVVKKEWNRWRVLADIQQWKNLNPTTTLPILSSNTLTFDPLP